MAEPDTRKKMSDPKDDGLGEEDYGLRLRLWQRRNELRMSQPTLGAVAGLDPSAISRYERGATEPRAESVRRLAIALGVSADWLLGLSDRKHR
jgi:transcriptional regulator with XRE-family HTH domain